MEYVIVLLGLVELGFICRLVYLWQISPVKFDRLLVKGFLKWTILGIVLFPFLLTSIALLLKGWASPVKFDDSLLFMSTYETFLNPSSFPGSSFGKRSYMLAVGIFGAFLLNGLLVSAVVAWIDRRRERWSHGDLCYSRFFKKANNKFFCIIGGNEIVPDLTRQLLTAKGNEKAHVIIMTNRDVPALRKKVVSLLGKQEEQVVICHGERVSREDLSRLQMAKAESIYIIGEQLDIEQSGSHHDVKNMECVKLIADILHQNLAFFDPKKGIALAGRKLCRVMFEYQSSFSVFQFTDVNSEIADVLNFMPFNYYETWAQNVFICDHLNVEAGKPRYLPLEGKKPITADSDDTVHLIIVGMSRMGIALGVEAAHLAHYPNFIHQRDKNLRTRITFIDSKARTEMQYFQGHYKELFAVSRWRYLVATNSDIYYNRHGHLPYATNDSSWHDPLHDPYSHSPYRETDKYTLGRNVVDIDWEFIQGDLEKPTVQHYIREAATQAHVRLTIAVCIPKDNASFAASLYLPDEVYAEDNNVVQVLAYQPYGDAMCQCFKDQIKMTGNQASRHPGNFNQFAKLKAFGMMTSCYHIGNQEKMEEAADQLWEQYEEAYKEYIGGRNALRTELNMPTPLKAGKSLAAKQWSNTYAAAHLWTKLRSIEWDENSELQEIPKGNKLDLLAEVEHIRWNTEQLLLGYAPLRPKERDTIMTKLSKAKTAKAPNKIPLKQELGDEAEKQRLRTWLDAWKGFDEEREILKAGMSHIDICSYEILRQIDEEAIQYDTNLTRILPRILHNIPNKDEDNLQAATH